MTWLALVSAAIVCMGCNELIAIDRFSVVDGGAFDAAAQGSDAGSLDAGQIDAGASDAGTSDAGQIDGGQVGVDASPGLPDLTVSCSAADVAGPASPTRVDVKVTNIGAGAAAPFRVRIGALIVGETTREVELGSAIFTEPLAPLENSTQSIGFTLPSDTTAGPIEATCVADALGEVPEQDEGNNVGMFVFSATELPNLTGSSSDTAFVVRNNGSGHSRAFHVWLYFSGNCVGPPHSQFHLDFLPSRGTHAETVTRRPTCAVVDPLDEVEESDETDNTVL